MEDPAAWFAHTLQLPAAALLPAVAVPLARMDADEAAALWEAWRDYVPTVLPSERAAAFAAALRRGVEAAVCAAYPEVAWFAVGAADADHVPESAWRLIVNDTPLSASTLRIVVHAEGTSVIVWPVQRRGERVPREERGPFRLP